MEGEWAENPIPGTALVEAGGYDIRQDKVNLAKKNRSRPQGRKAGLPASKAVVNY